MPNLDGTGPMGQGAMTGSKRGRCKNSRNLELTNNEIKSKESKEFFYRNRRGRRQHGVSDFGNRFNHGYGKREGRGCGRRFGN